MVTPRYEEDKLLEKRRRKLEREEKAAAYIQERFRGRGTVRKSSSNLRIKNEIENEYRRESYGGRKVRPRGSEDNSVHSDQPPYYKRRVRLEDGEARGR